MAKSTKPKSKIAKVEPRAPKAAPQRTIRAKTAKASKARTRAPLAAAPVKTPAAAAMIPGQYFLRSEPIVANADRHSVEISVANQGDRPIQVGSHFHFYEVNRALQFERERAYGMRLDIAAGTAVRFEPGQSKKVTLIALAGKREVWGFNALVNGPLR